MASKVSAKKPAAKKTPKHLAAKKPAAMKLAVKKARAKEAAKKIRKKAARKKAAAAKHFRKPNAAFMKPMTPSVALGAVIGMRSMPRTEVTKRIWAYIKKNKLQDPVNRRMINADEKLAAVFRKKGKGNDPGPSVSMFEMTKLVSKHLK